MTDITRDLAVTGLQPHHSHQSIVINPLTAKLSNLNFHSLEVVSR